MTYTSRNQPVLEKQWVVLCRDLQLLLSSTIVCVFVFLLWMREWVSFSWTRVSEVGCSSSPRGIMEIRGTIQAVMLSLVLLLLVGWGTLAWFSLCPPFKRLYQWFCMFRPLTYKHCRPFSKASINYYSSLSTAGWCQYQQGLLWTCPCKKVNLKKIELKIKIIKTVTVDGKLSKLGCLSVLKCTRKQDASKHSQNCLQ